MQTQTIENPPERPVQEGIKKLVLYCFLFYINLRKSQGVYPKKFKLILF